MKYNLLEPWKTLDPWQERYIAAEGNCFLLCGRQSGKTVGMSVKSGKRAAEINDKTTLMLAFTEKQAYNLFFKTLMYLRAKYPKLIRKGKDKPTKHIINLNNGSKIMCYAAGLTGEGIRTFTVDHLVIDEAAPMAREVFVATTPMLSVTKGTLDIASTPRGKEGYFYECSDDPGLGTKIKKNFTRFYVSAEDCPRHSKEFLESERAAMSKLEYAQEYLAMFLDEVRQFFPTELIKRCMVLREKEAGLVGPAPPSSGDNFLGVDVARMGEDESVLFSLKRNIRKTILTQIAMEITKKTLTTETVRRIKNADNTWKYKTIYIDDGGMGVAVFDPLLEDKQTKRKVVAINNASRSIDNEKRGKKLLKEDLYNNLLHLMESKKIQLWKSKEIMHSLQSVQAEYINGKLRIFGRYTHIAEALIRAAWCMKNKRLKPFIA